MIGFIKRWKEKRKLNQDVKNAYEACTNPSLRGIELSCGGRIVIPTRKRAMFPSRAVAHCHCHDHRRGLLLNPLAQQDIYCPNLMAVCQVFIEHDELSPVRTVRDANQTNTKRGKGNR